MQTNCDNQKWRSAQSMPGLPVSPMGASDISFGWQCAGDFREGHGAALVWTLGRRTDRPARAPTG
jgi:hypothetical protein